MKIDVFRHNDVWYWRTEHGECSPEYYFSPQVAKSIARLNFPGAMLLVHK
jgi:hypothetical protein